MRPHVRIAAAAAGTVLAAVAVTACSGSSSPSSSAVGAASPSYAAQEATSAAPATITTKTVPLGKILVNDMNLTLYLFQADKTTKSTCTGACAAAWPPLVIKGKPVAAGGVQSKLLSTTKRSDGTTQVTYKGHPLYRFAGDSKPGDVNGQGLNNFGAKWYVLGTDGKQITAAASQNPGAGGY